ncbi:hypothetical protein EJP82_00040 [Paenibacillus anaericanus]|uniref:Uncharacterized protein n=1 Tax=Paenibacillus anaericanus TaxID=170367 RepID=A0A433YES6_9BACL|nr:hypothetical protein EJP82_00040 [Paenibacillus anaericanus]
MLEISKDKWAKEHKNDMCKRFYKDRSVLYDVSEDKALSILETGLVSGFSREIKVKRGTTSGFMVSFAQILGGHDVYILGGVI